VRATDTEFASVTPTVKFAVPATVGVPLICAPDKLNPCGRAPPEIDHVYGTVPPLACNVWEYATPTWPPVKLLVDIVRAGVTTILRLCVSDSGFFPEPVALTVKLNVPDEVGDPPMVPPLDNERPPGKLPAETLQL